jgi:nicotinamide-nucleotide amidase
VTALFASALIESAEELLQICKERQLTITTAESCTGGLLAAVLTEVPGSSKVFERGIVTYSNEAKEELLKVGPQLIKAYGAVSGEVALAMAEGALELARASMAISITGVAGPGGGTAEKPVGLIFLACLRDGKDAIASRLELGRRTRRQIREAAVAEALRLLRIQADR